MQAELHAAILYSRRHHTFYYTCLNNNNLCSKNLNQRKLVETAQNYIQEASQRERDEARKDCILTKQVIFERHIVDVHQRPESDVGQLTVSLHK